MRSIILVVMLLLFPVVIFSDADEISGIWFTEDEKGKVKIYKENGRYHGEIFWMDNIGEEGGPPENDIKNPDPEKRGRKLVGLRILKNFKYDNKDDQWVDGEIYDPRSGKTYSSKLELKDKGKILEVRGYIGLPLFGKSQEWKRAE